MRLYYLGPTPMARLAHELETDRTTFTRNVKVMVDFGIVEITSTDDKRSKLVGMTNKGFAALTKAIPKWEQT
jgi:DNA-binding MarR family transcriptional regulator